MEQFERQDLSNAVPTWSARHLNGARLEISSWSEIYSHLANVGTTEWDWLAAWKANRSVCCHGFADVLTVDITEWDTNSRTERTWQLGLGAPGGRWVDAGCNLQVRQSQVLPLPHATAAFYDWLELGRIPNFTLEEI